MPFTRSPDPKNTPIVVEKFRKFWALDKLPTAGGFEEIAYVIDQRSFYVYSEGTWQAVGGGGGGGSGAPISSPYVTRTSDVTLSNEFALGSLATGILRNTTTTGIPTIAIAGTHYLLPDGSGASLTDLNASALSTGTVSTARLGTGTASSSTFLRGDNTWATPSGGGVTDAGFIVQTPHAGLSAEQALSTLATGILKNTTSTGVLTIAAAGTDYLSPSGSGASLTALNASQLTTGTVAIARLGSTGTADNTTFLRGDGAWAVPAGGGGGGAPLSSKYIVQTSDGTLTAEQALGDLATGILKNTTSTGVLTIAAAGTDYLSPSGSGASLTALNASNITTGTVAVARLGSGTPSASTYLRGDGAWTAPSFAPVDAKYIVQTADSTLTGEQALGSLATGILKNTTTTGVLTIAAAGTDYLSPSGSGASLTALNATQLTTGTVAVARLGSSGTASSSTFLRGDNTWATPTGSGDALTTAVNTFTHGQIVRAATGEVGLALRATTNANALNIEDSGGVARTSFDKDGYGLIDRATFLLARGSNLVAGTNLTSVGNLVSANGRLWKWKAIAKINGAGTAGGFTFDINRNGTSIFTTPPSVAASTTTVQSGSTFASTTIAEGDELTIDIDSAGTAISWVLITLYYLVRNS